MSSTCIFGASSKTHCDMRYTIRYAGDAPEIVSEIVSGGLQGKIVWEMEEIEQK